MVFCYSSPNGLRYRAAHRIGSLSSSCCMPSWGKKKKKKKVEKKKEWNMEKGQRILVKDTKDRCHRNTCFYMQTDGWGAWWHWSPEDGGTTKRNDPKLYLDCKRSRKVMSYGGRGTPGGLGSKGQKGKKAESFRLRQRFSMLQHYSGCGPWWAMGECGEEREDWTAWK
jgi:hypothetical protein